MSNSPQKNVKILGTARIFIVHKRVRERGFVEDGRQLTQ